VGAAAPAAEPAGAGPALTNLTNPPVFATLGSPPAGVPGPLGDPAAPLARGHRLGADPLHASVGRGWINAGCPAAQSRIVAARRDAPAGGSDDRLVGVDLPAALAAVV